MFKRLYTFVPIFLLVTTLTAVDRNTAGLKGESAKRYARDARRLPTEEQLKRHRSQRQFMEEVGPRATRGVKAAQAYVRHSKIEKAKSASKRKKGREQSREKQLRRTLQKGSGWQSFTQKGKIVKSWNRTGTAITYSAPTVLINGAASATIDPHEPFTVTVTFSEGSGDSGLVELFFDADGDNAVGESDIPITKILPSPEGDEGGPGWIFDNSSEDKDATDGVFSTTIDDFPFMGLEVIMQVTDAGGAGQAILTVNNLTGDYTASGTVTPVSNPALVIFQNGWQDPFFTFTDASGAFSFGFLDLQGGFMIGAIDVVAGLETGGFLLHAEFTEEPEELNGVTIDVTTGAEASGTIVDSETGEPVEGAYVNIGASTSFNESLFSYSTTDANGAFILPLQSGHLYGNVWADHPDYMGDSCTDYDYPVYVDAGDVIDLSCDLEPWSAFVEGHVTDASSGDPIQDIEVSVSVWDDDFGEGAWNSTWTDENGFYRLGIVYGYGDLWAADWEERRYQEYYTEIEIDEPLITEDIEMEPYDGAIAGTVTDAESDKPLAEADVYAFTSDYGLYTSGWTDGDGVYLMPAMNGTYTVCASHWWGGYEEDCVDNVVVSDDTAKADIALEPPSEIIEGYVYDAETGDPIGEIEVDAFNDENWYYAFTDANGYFKMGIDNGVYEVCYYDWSNTYDTDDICVEDVEVEDNTVTLAPMNLMPIEWDGAMKGKVEDQFGNPVMAWVSAWDTTEWEGNQTFSDENGEYVLPLNNGRYMAVAQPYQWGYLTDAAMGISVSDDTTSVNFVTLIVQIDASIEGSVTDTLGGSIPEAWVAAEGWSDFEGGPYFDTESDEGGAYEMGVMGFDDRHYWVFGDYWDEDSDEWWVGGVDSVVVGSGDTVTIDLELGPIVYNSSISGRVTQEGDPVGSFVEAYNMSSGDYFGTETEQDGRYRMSVSDGEYEVCAYLWETDQSRCEYVSAWEEDVTVNFRFGPPPPPVTFVPNKHGNFRFSWSNYGEMTRWDDEEGMGPNGEWPAESGNHYLYGGGLMVTGYTDEGGLAMGGVYSEGWMPGRKDISVEAPAPYEVITRHMVDRAGWMPTHLKVKEVIVTQDDTDVVIVGTRIRYDGPGEMGHIYAGYFLDWDFTFTEDDSDEFWKDDLAGMIEVTLTDPVHGTAIPLKVSYMMDQSGDSYAGMATLFESGTGASHISLDAEDWEGAWFPSEYEFIDMLQAAKDSPNETEPSDYRVMQVSDAVELATGEDFRFITVLMMADSPEDFSVVLQNAMTMVAGQLWHFTADVDEDDAPLPTKYALHQNHPNPFNPLTTIRYDVPEASDVRLTIYDMLGREVTVLVNRHLTPGSYAAIWDGSHQSGRDLAAGVYIYQLKARNFVSTKKMIFLK